MIVPQNTLGIILATRNEAKVREIEKLLSGLPITLTGVSSLSDMPEVEENEGTLEGNAIKKAQTIFDLSGIPTLADDTGLIVDTLGGDPGVRSARYASENATDAENRAFLLEQMLGKEDRTARFCTVAAYVDDGGIYIFEGACEGSILKAEVGDSGFGYDSIFLPADCSSSFAQMSAEEKNRISHRGKALRKCVVFLQEITADV